MVSPFGPALSSACCARTSCTGCAPIRENDPLSPTPTGNDLKQSRVQTHTYSKFWSPLDRTWISHRRCPPTTLAALRPRFCQDPVSFSHTPTRDLSPSPFRPWSGLRRRPTVRKGPIQEPHFRARDFFPKLYLEGFRRISFFSNSPLLHTNVLSFSDDSGQKVSRTDPPFSPFVPGEARRNIEDFSRPPA